MKYLIDNCVISEVIKPNPNDKVLAWIDSQADVDLYLSALTIGEIRKGIERARPANPTAAARYEAWLGTLVSHYGGRILPLDEPAAQAWGILMSRVPNSGVEDAQIAAIAQSRGMTVVTRNIADFKDFAIPLINPF